VGRSPVIERRDQPGGHGVPLWRHACLVMTRSGTARPAVCQACGLILLTVWTASATAQTISVGLLSVGPVAVERTHHVRLGSLGNDLYAGIAGERGSGPMRVTATFRLSPTAVFVWACREQPCEHLGRGARPQNADTYRVLWTDAQLGLRARSRFVNAGGGPAVTVLSGCASEWWGACPMAVLGAWADVRISPVRWAGLELGAGWIPPQTARWTVFDAAAGAGPYPKGRKPIVPLHVGVWVGK
jgi:hypothetical protein